MKPETTRLVNVSAKYETVKERVIDVPEHTVWKKGKSPYATESEVDASGDILCKVKFPRVFG
ncbi:MAG: hypothetical protein HRU19_13435 [Pseudobacteriovorax sp.]|nr:hypothetical protein [Pseudobacteriovorax sp.]